MEYPDGVRALVETLKAPLCDEDGLSFGILGISRNITERNKAENALAYQANMQNILMNISTKYINLPLHDAKTVINQSLEEIGKFVEADRVSIFHFKNAVADKRFSWCNAALGSQIDSLSNIPNEFFQNWMTVQDSYSMVAVPDVTDLPEDNLLREFLIGNRKKKLFSLADYVRNGMYRPLNF